MGRGRTFAYSDGLIINKFVNQLTCQVGDSKAFMAKSVNELEGLASLQLQ